MSSNKVYSFEKIEKQKGWCCGVILPTVLYIAGYCAIISIRLLYMERLFEMSNDQIVEF